MNSRPDTGDAAGQWPLDFTDHVGDLLRHAAFEYRLELGWRTTVHGDQLVLLLDEDIIGLLMPTALAVDLVAVLRARRLSCPVVSLPDPADPRSILLLEPSPRQPAPPLPVCVDVLPGGQHIALPPTMTPRGPVRWLTPHDPSRLRRPPARLVADELHRLARPATTGPANRPIQTVQTRRSDVGTTS